MSEQDAAGETWEVTTRGGPIKYVRGDQEFDLSRVVGRWKMRDYLNALTREAAAAHNEAEMWHVLADMASIEHDACHDEAAHYRREELQREAADLRRKNETLTVADEALREARTEIAQREGDCARMQFDRDETLKAIDVLQARLVQAVTAQDKAWRELREQAPFMGTTWAMREVEKRADDALALLRDTEEE